jgi:hypothetical protein
MISQNYIKRLTLLFAILLCNIIVLNAQTITLSSPAGTDSQTTCINTAINSITYTTTGATGVTITGLPPGAFLTWSNNLVTISGTPTVTGLYNYTITTTGGTGVATATGKITVQPNNTITLSSAAGTKSQTICLGNSIANINYTTSFANGATVTGLPNGIVGSWSNNSFTISGTPTTSGSFIYYINTIGGCAASSDTGKITVYTIPSIPTISRDMNNNLVSSFNGINSWYKDAAIVNNATSSIFKPTVNGLYSVKANNNGCESGLSSSYYYIVTDISIINGAEYIKVGPNPFNSYIDISLYLKTSKFLNVDIYSTSTGELLYQQKNLQPNTRINLNSLSSGHYILRLFSNDLFYNFKYKLIKL